MSLYTELFYTIDAFKGQFFAPCNDGIAYKTAIYVECTDRNIAQIAYQIFQYISSSFNDSSSKKTVKFISQIQDYQFNPGFWAEERQNRIYLISYKKEQKPEQLSFPVIQQLHAATDKYLTSIMNNWKKSSYTNAKYEELFGSGYVVYEKKMTQNQFSVDQKILSYIANKKDITIAFEIHHQPRPHVRVNKQLKNSQYIESCKYAYLICNKEDVEIMLQTAQKEFSPLSVS